MFSIKTLEKIILLKIKFTTVILTLLALGLLHNLASAKSLVKFDQGSNQTLSNDLWQQNLDESLTRSSYIKVQKYRLKSQSKLNIEIPSLYKIKRLLDQISSAVIPLTLPTPWFITNTPPKTYRVSGWKDNNLPHKHQIILFA